jgi:hypothetical protein
MGRYLLLDALVALTAARSALATAVLALPTMVTVQGHLSLEDVERIKKAFGSGATGAGR